ncbi:MAG: hypothetical protein EA398_05610 [Deltaproteobacteria bacterium]|nr:MAG: hypothetical protein EA398_05610 [Deltaproteobacteria bacterium]
MKSESVQQFNESEPPDRKDRARVAAVRSRPIGATARRLLPLLAFVVTAVLLTGLQLSDRMRMPAREALLEASRHLQEAAGEDSLILVRPPWFNEGRIGLEGLHLHPATPLDPLELHPFREVFVAQGRGRRSALEVELAAVLEEEGPLFESPRWRVKRYRTALPWLVHWDSLAALQDATIRRHAEGAAGVSCRLGHGRSIHCGRVDPWVYAADTWREMEDLRPQWCIGLAVPHDQERMTFEWDEVPLGSQLRIRAGNDVHATRSPRGADVTMTVSLDDTVVWERAFPPREEPYLLEDIEVPGGSDAARLGVSLHTEDALDRFFCFRVFSYTETGAPQR